MTDWNQIIRLLIITPLAANFIAERSGVMEWIKFKLYYRIYSRKTKYKLYRIKPFDCAMCLSFWLCLIQVLPSQNWLEYFFPFAAAAVGSIVSKF